MSITKFDEKLSSIRYLLDDYKINPDKNTIVCIKSNLKKLRKMYSLLWNESIPKS